MTISTLKEDLNVRVTNTKLLIWLLCFCVTEIPDLGSADDSFVQKKKKGKYLGQTVERQDKKDSQTLFCQRMF